MSVAEVFERHLAILEQFIHHVDRLCENRKSQGNFIGKWIRDDDVHAAVGLMKTTGEGLSQSCTRLSMLALNNAISVEAGESLLQEILRAAGSYVTSFEQILPLEVGLPLFEQLEAATKSELRQVQAFLKVVAAGDFEQCKFVIGQVWHVAESLTRLPIGNKAAYRRDMLEKLRAIKDTHREFSELLTSEPIEEDEFDELDDSYTDSERPIARACCELFALAVDVIKITDNVMIKISEMDSAILADITNPSIAANNITAAVQSAVAEMHRNIVLVNTLTEQKAAAIGVMAELLQLAEVWQHALDDAARDGLANILSKLQQQRDSML